MLIIACKLVKCIETYELYNNKKYSYLTRFKNVAFHAKILYALKQRGPHHVVCLKAPTILDPPLKANNDYHHHFYIVLRVQAQPQIK